MKLKVSQINGKEIDKNFIKDHNTINQDNSFNVVIEIPSGTNEKWEVSKLSGSIVREFYMGKPRDINFGPYPVNYGMLPRTVLPISRGGDGDPLDIFVLGSPFHCNIIYLDNKLIKLELKLFLKIYYLTYNQYILF